MTAMTCQGCGRGPASYEIYEGERLCLDCAHARVEADITAADVALACVEGVVRAALNGEAAPADVLARVGEIIGRSGPNTTTPLEELHVHQRTIYRVREALRPYPEEDAADAA